jgi:hypothetical protein
MKKKFFVSMVLVVIAAMTLGLSAVVAQTPPGPATSWPFLRNPTGTAATAVIDFYNLSGTKVHTVNNFAVPANSTVLVPVYSYDALGTNFSGSMVVSSDVQLIAMCNVIATDSSGGSYSGAQSGAASVTVPAVHKNDWGWYSEISVQNVGSTDASVTVAFTPAPAPYGSGSAYTTPAQVIKPGAAYRWNTANISNIGTTFVGAAVATSTGGNIIAVCEEWNTAASHMTLLYNGIPAGGSGTTAYLPAQHNSNYGWYSYNFVRETSGTAGTLNYEWVGTGGTSGSVPIAANGMVVLATADYLGTTDYVGALKLTATGGAQILAICNEVNSNGYQAGSYNASYAGDTVMYFPAQHNQNYGWQSFNFIYNPSGTAANVTVTWSKTDGTGSVPAPFTTSVPANGRLGLYTQDYLTGDVYGSLKVECTNAVDLVGVCNEVDTDAAAVDAFISYNGFGQ